MPKNMYIGGLMHLTRLLTVSLIVMFSHFAFADGVFMVVKGDVRLVVKGKAPVAAKVGMKVNDPDRVIAGKDARAKIVMTDKNVLNISPNSEVIIETYKTAEADGKKEVSLNVLYGKVRATVNQKYDGEKSKFQVKTPSAVAGVRGTDFVTEHNASTNQSKVVAFEGTVSVSDESGKNPVSVHAGEMSVAKGDGPPATPTKVPPAELQAMNKESSTDGGKRPDSSGDRGVATDKKEDKKEEKKQENNKEGDKKDKGAKEETKKEEKSDKKAEGEKKTEGDKKAEKSAEKSPSASDKKADSGGDKKAEGEKSPRSETKAEGDKGKSEGGGQNAGGPKGPPVPGGPSAGGADKGGGNASNGPDVGPRQPSTEAPTTGPGPGTGTPSDGPMTGGMAPNTGPEVGPCLTCDIIAAPEPPPIPQLPELPPVLGDIYQPPVIPPDIINANTNLTVIINVQ
jgi:hypothetical protein